MNSLKNNNNSNNINNSIKPDGGKKRTFSLTVRDIALMGMMVAVIEVCKVALAGIPNVELTTFWVILFSLYFGNRIFLVIPVFILIEGAMYGFGLWWIMYLYTWPSLAIFCRLFRKSNSALTWSTLSSSYGFLYGFLCSIPYFFIGASSGGIGAGLQMAFAWWVAGIPFDLIHGIANFILMLVLYYPMRRVMQSTRNLFLQK